MIEQLKVELAERALTGLNRKRRLLQSPQAAHLVADGQHLLSFASNDYLGLANHPDLISALQKGATEAGVGGGASHLITGHHQFHHDAEQALAGFVGLPAGLLFSTGYMANMGVGSALLGRNDAILADKLNHASLKAAAVLARAKLNRYPHQDLAQLEKMLADSRAPRKLVIVDAVFSMDGDIASVPELLALCEKYDAYLLLDDAHGFGVLGKQGHGILSHFNVASPRIIYMATLGKAAGVAGAFVAGSGAVVVVMSVLRKVYHLEDFERLIRAVNASKLVKGLNASQQLTSEVIEGDMKNLVHTDSKVVHRTGKGLQGTEASFTTNFVGGL